MKKIWGIFTCFTFSLFAIFSSPAAINLLQAAGDTYAIKDIFPDENLAQEIQNTLGKGSTEATVDTTELESITFLDISDKGVTSISGFEYLTKLQEVYMNNNFIEDLTPLQYLDSLTFIQAINNQIVELEPLNNLVNLTALVLNENQISDISLFSSGNFTALSILALGENQISDISPLAQTTNVAALSLENNKITDITVLSSLEELRMFRAENNLIRNISSLSGLEQLHTLYLDGNQITDVAALSPLIDMYDLSIANQKIYNTSINYAENIVISNNIFDENSNIISPSTISNGGIYNAPNVEWTITNYIPELSYDFSNSITVGSSSTIFSGQVIQPLAQTYTVSYDGNGNDGGILPTDTNEYITGDIVTIATGQPTKTGYNFTGWDYQGTTYHAGDTFTVTDNDITFVAQWQNGDIPTEQLPDPETIEQLPTTGITGTNNIFFALLLILLSSLFLFPLHLKRSK